MGLATLVPFHVAIIMDGNGRWAKKRGLPRIAGHREGAKAVERVIYASLKRGIRYLSLFAFSTENWKRPEPEVYGLMNILKVYFLTKIEILKWAGVRIRFGGRWWELQTDLVNLIEKAIKSTEKNKKLDVIVYLNYGGRQEILDAVASIISQGNGSLLSEETFRSHLYMPDVPDPDLLIRTSGEKRISNFLLWQLAYTELYFSETLWPDFGEEELDSAIAEYNRRERRFGGVL
ncbi:MAG: di-trans,poly-cis-decaprenylcistransferase [Synergistetes bacterium]|nr:MAG: Isoprenyl transferase [bacterium 42_11]MBC7332246.1 di-trans,poly-cis-decaprenylcistransferase [Synergistota bacterium]MDK2871302.1 undecaprenyl diphosphate synthase [bacterium]